MILSGTLIIVAGILGMLFFGNFFQNNGQETNYIYGSGPYPEVPRIGVSHSKLAYDRNDAVFLDVRNSEYYIRSHIDGAISIPESEIQVKYIDLSPSDWIIVYCS